MPFLFAQLSPLSLYIACWPPSICRCCLRVLISVVGSQCCLVLCYVLNIAFWKAPCSLIRVATLLSTLFVAFFRKLCFWVPYSFPAFPGCLAELFCFLRCLVSITFFSTGVLSFFATIQSNWSWRLWLSTVSFVDLWNVFMCRVRSSRLCFCNYRYLLALFTCPVLCIFYIVVFGLCQIFSMRCASAYVVPHPV